MFKPESVGRAREEDLPILKVRVEKECILLIRARGGELVDVCVEAGELKEEDERREGGGRREREEGR